jgi:hypothetical protein
MTHPKEEDVELVDGVNEWLGFAERLGPAQKRVILGLSAEWGPSPDHQTTKRMWYGVTGRGIKRQRGPLYVVEHKHRTDNCWRLNSDGLRLQVALWHLCRRSTRQS